MFSKRRVLSLLMGGAAAGLAGCTSRGHMAPFDAEAAALADASVYRILVGSNRPLDHNNFAAVGRAREMNFSYFDVSIPATRETGRIQWPSPNPDPSTEFVTTDAARFRDDAAFVANIRAELSKLPPGRRDALVFVHGYNTNLAEGVYRLAQMDHDLDLNMVPIYFSWPTAERAVGYVYDRDSALFSRGDLARLLRLVRSANPDRLTLMSHSMGCFLTSETMLGMDLKTPGSVPTVIDDLVMMSPDIDVDLSLSQLSAISALPRQFVVFTSNSDKALELSARLVGSHPRLGRNPDVARFEDIEVTFLDVTAFSDPDAGDYGHLTVGTSQALIELIPKLREAAESLDTDIAANPGILPGTVLSVRRATEVVLTPGP